MASQFLFGAEVDRIQDTLFRAARQRQVVGGSYLLAEFGKRAVELANTHHARDILIKAGGNFRVLFDSKDDATAFGRDLANAYRLLLDASITIAAPELCNGNFPEINERIHEEIMRLKRAQRGETANLQAPSTAFCQSSGVGLAYTYQKLPWLEAEQYISAFASKMGEAGKIGKEFRGVIEEPNDSYLGQIKAHLPDNYKPLYWPDVDEIANFDGERANVAYLLADGNNMGKLFKNCDDKELKLLSKALEDAMCAAIAKPIESLFQKFYEAEKFKTGEFMPLLPLILAGDDAFVLVPACYALDFAQKFCLAFEHALGQSDIFVNLREKLRKKNLDIPPPTMSAAIVFCKGHYPYHLAYWRGKELLTQTKQMVKAAALETKQWRSALAFAMIVGSELVTGHEADGAYRPSLSPYWIAESDLSLELKKFSLALRNLLLHRFQLKILPAKRLAEAEKLFAPEALPNDDEDWRESLKSWNSQLRKLLDRIEVTDPQQQQLQRIKQALADLGDPVNRDLGHWREVKRPGKHYQAHGLPDLISVWNYAQSFNHSLAEYREEES